MSATTELREEQPASGKRRRGKKEEPEAPVAPAYPNPAKPSALLVPKYIRDRRAAQKTTRQAYYAVFIVAALMVLAILWAFWSAISANGDKVDAYNARDAAQTQVDKLAPIAAYYDGIEQRQTIALTALKSDVKFGDMASKIASKATAADVTLTGMKFTPGTICPGPDPFAPSQALGCVTINATTSNIANTARFAESLNDVTGLTGAYAKNFTPDQNQGFTVTVNYTMDWLSWKYVPASQKDQIAAGFKQQQKASAASTTGATP